MLAKAGFVLGGIAGGMVGGMATNYLANSFVTNILGPQYAVDNPNWMRSGLLKIFNWLNLLG